MLDLDKTVKKDNKTVGDSGEKQRRAWQNYPIIWD
jgi:hypothetical protein